MAEEANQAIVFFTGFQVSDLRFMTEAAGRTLLISVISISCGTALGCIFGWMVHSLQLIGAIALNFVLDFISQCAADYPVNFVFQPVSTARHSL